jgi:hypothetical protein
LERRFKIERSWENENISEDKIANFKPSRMDIKSIGRLIMVDDQYVKPSQPRETRKQRVSSWKRKYARRWPLNGKGGECEAEA